MSSLPTPQELSAGDGSGPNGEFTGPDNTPVQYIAPLAATAMFLIWPAALLLANLLAAWSGRRAARLRISTVLLAE